MDRAPRGHAPLRGCEGGEVLPPSRRDAGCPPLPDGRARHSVRAAIVVRTGGGQRTPINREQAARPTEACSDCLWELV
jgi:hypothetical protein